MAHQHPLPNLRLSHSAKDVLIASLKQSEHPTDTVIHPLPAQCDRCQMPLPKDGARVSARRQVIELPKIPCEIIEHQILEQVCNCGHVHVCARRRECAMNLAT